MSKTRNENIDWLIASKYISHWKYLVKRISNLSGWAFCINCGRVGGVTGTTNVFFSLMWDNNCLYLLEKIVIFPKRFYRFLQCWRTNFCGLVSFNNYITVIMLVGDHRFCFNSRYERWQMCYVMSWKNFRKTVILWFYPRCSKFAELNIVTLCAHRIENFLDPECPWSESTFVFTCYAVKSWIWAPLEYKPP